MILAQWMQPGDKSRCISWARETYERMRPFSASCRYVIISMIARRAIPSRLPMDRAIGVCSGSRQNTTDELLPHEPENPPTGLIAD